MTPVQLPEVPAHIGLIVGVRLTPSNTNEFYGYFEPSYRGLEKERVYTAAQLREYATEDRANVLAAILAIIPGGSICDPQHIADDIRALLTPSETNSD